MHAESAAANEAADQMIANAECQRVWGTRRFTGAHRTASDSGCWKWRRISAPPWAVGFLAARQRVLREQLCNPVAALSHWSHCWPLLTRFGPAAEHSGWRADPSQRAADPTSGAVERPGVVSLTPPSALLTRFHWPLTLSTRVTGPVWFAADPCASAPACARNRQRHCRVCPTTPWSPPCPSVI